MKTLAELEQLRSELVDRFYDESTKLAGWDSETIAKISAKAYKEEDNAWNDDWRVLKANSALLGAYSTAINALDKMIKERTKKSPVKDVGEVALEKIRGK